MSPRQSASRRSKRPSASADVYRQRIVEHYRAPRNFGALKSCDAKCRESNFSCGDDLEFFLKMKADRVADVSFQGHGCALSVAAASLLTESIRNQSATEVLDLEDQDIIDLLGLGPLTGSRLRCATLSLKGIQQAVRDWQETTAKKKR
jgi:nitrogen fixation NifU-like protein